MRIQTKRIYEGVSADDGRRILVDRLWPRGISKEKAALDFWARACAPSNELRNWYQHRHERWEEFRSRYWSELDDVPESVAELRSQMGTGEVTLVFSSKEEQLNNATALKQYLERS